MKFKFTPALIIFVGALGAIAFLFYTGGLSGELFLVFAFFAIVAFLWHLQEKKEISFDEAREIAKTKILLLQKRREIPLGNVYTGKETSIRYLEIPTNPVPTIIPNHYDVVVVVENGGMHAYLVRVSYHGNVMTTTELKAPTDYRVTKEGLVTKATGVPKKEEEIKEEEKKSEKP